MKPRVLPIDTPVNELTEELHYTTARLQAYPFLATQAGQHEALITDSNQLMQTELALMRALMQAEARKFVIDVRLDSLCSAIDGTLRVELGGNRKSPIYERYFGNLQPSRLKRSVLGEQLEIMRGWVSSLTSPQSSATLQAYGNQLAECVGEADLAERAEADARHSLADHTIGPRKEFVGRFNALRQALYGQLAELPHGRPELGLPPDFAHHFFLRGPRRPRPTLATLERDIARLQAQLQRAEAERDRLRAEAEAEAEQYESSELAEAEAELAAIEQQRLEAAARIAELQARRTTPTA